MGEAKRKLGWVDLVVEFIRRERMRGNEFPRTVALLKELEEKRWAKPNASAAVRPQSKT
jgi:hypothetical protein